MSEYSSHSIPAGDYCRINLTFPHNNEMSYPCWQTDERDRISSLAPSPASFSSSESGIKSEEMKKNPYKHVPHKERPPLIVARRNARERRRVQAVNTAFMKLRKIVPIVNNRSVRVTDLHRTAALPIFQNWILIDQGKRVSKVKTLQTAIDYISGLQALLKQADMYHDLDIISEYRYPTDDFIHEFEDFEAEF